MCMIVMSVVVACSSNSSEDASNAPEPQTTTDDTSTTTEPNASEASEEETDEMLPLTVGLEAEPTSLDPFNATDGNSANIQQTIYEGLLRFDPDMNLEFLLATGYEYNEDATAITFTLRQGVTFHDGSTFNAEVVKANLDFVRNDENGLARSSFFSFIDEVIIEDENTVTIRSAEPNSAMASYMAHVSATFKSINEITKKVEDSDYNLDRNAIGTGPYKFLEWKDGQYVKVVPNDNYWNADQLPKLKDITFIPVQEASTRVNMLKTGELDVISKLPTLNAEELSQAEGIDVFTGPSLNVFYVGISLKHEKYQDVRVRQAMNYAIDKNALISQVVDGYGTIADSAIAPGVYGYKSQQAYTYDLDKAKQLMEEAGYENGFEATLWTRNETSFVAVAENIAIQLEKIGVKVKVEPYESGTLFDMLDNNKGTDLYIGRWSPGTGEADWGLRPNFASDRVPPNYNNSGFYVNEQVDTLLNSAIQTSDQNEALAHYAEVQEIVYEEAPWLFLFVPDNVVAKRSNVSGVTVLPADSVLVGNADKE
ncbi:glutathione ABC transporter substrate-binding protein [Bacillus sp. HMF5848]|nr:glutathione ABC transporter substrate-binding protein [Bacillus sp. HMF5848]